MEQTTANECDHQSVAGGSTTGQLANELEVHVHTVQRWHREGLIRPAWVTPGGHPRWAVEDVRSRLAEVPRDRDSGPPFSPELADAPKHPYEPS
ncbi:MerR family DNA-binding transcriptional regulator [Actinomycetospora flava]|uniref:MerR family DNA-binding transcriptional regulator n=1 Tax=Actinomycetospora flava TaxID=3129232 RepID=A0ABU8M5G2_9PSEU